MEKNIDQGYRELVALGTRLRSSLDRYFDSVRDFDVFAKPPLLKSAREEIEFWIFTDFIGLCRKGAHLNVGVPEEDIEPYYYLKRNPSYAG